MGVLIEARVHDAWCPLAKPFSATWDLADDEAINAAMMTSHAYVEYPELGVVAVWPRGYAWRIAP